VNRKRRERVSPALRWPRPQFGWAFRHLNPRTLGLLDPL
jgi:hypothetical protein